MVLRQEELIAAVRVRCESDPNVEAALMYGSFAQGLGDAYSDIEFWLFFNGLVDPFEWLRSIAAYECVVVNEFGTHVAFFSGLIRGEFHFATAGDIETVRSWPARSAPISSMVIVDRNGALATALSSLPAIVEVPSSAPAVAEMCGRYANWLVLAHHVTLRGERLRAQDALSHVRRHLLWMIRLSIGRTDPWLTPSRRAEADLPADVVAAVASTDLEVLWRCGRSYWERLASGFGFEVPAALFASLDSALIKPDQS